MDLLDGAGACIRIGRLLPATCLCLVAVDTMAWLGRLLSAKRVKREQFIKWVNGYLLPGTALACTAVEIYSMRCGLLHSQSPRSDLVESYAARSVWFACGAPKSAGGQLDGRGSIAA